MRTLEEAIKDAEQRRRNPLYWIVLTGAVAERFLSTRVEEVAAETQEEVAEDIDDVVAELREIRTGLERLELRFGRR